MLKLIKWLEEITKMFEVLKVLDWFITEALSNLESYYLNS